MSANKYMKWGRVGAIASLTFLFLSSFTAYGTGPTFWDDFTTWLVYLSPFLAVGLGYWVSGDHAITLALLFYVAGIMPFWLANGALATQVVVSAPFAVTAGLFTAAAFTQFISRR